MVLLPPTATIACKGALPSGADQELGRLEFVDKCNSGSTIVAISDAVDIWI